jgi:excisionase family DNA binding protein
MNETPNRPLLKKKELAKALGVSPRTIDTWVSQRVIPFIAPSPRLHLFDVQAVKSALNAKFEVSRIEHTT